MKDNRPSTTARSRQNVRRSSRRQAPPTRLHDIPLNALQSHPTRFSWRGHDYLYVPPAPCKTTMAAYWQRERNA